MNNLESGELESLLAGLDALAVAGVARAAPVRFNIAQTPSELEAVYRLRYRVAFERNWATPADLPDGLERDAYDDRAVQIVGSHNGEPVASVRLVFPSPGMRLPTEEIFNLDIEPRGQVVDISRAIVTAEFGDIGHRVFGGLVSQAWSEVRARGFCWVCGYAERRLTRLYRLMGIETTELGQPQTTWGVTRYPIRFETPPSAVNLMWQLGRLLKTTSKNS